MLQACNNFLKTVVVKPVLAHAVASKEFRESARDQHSASDGSEHTAGTGTAEAHTVVHSTQYVLQVCQVCVRGQPDPEPVCSDMRNETFPYAAEVSTITTYGNV